ncbi:hypothetical protein QOT17_016536 [Balamuthia mandrillaris]
MGDGLLNLNLHLATFDPSSVNLDLDHICIFTIHPKVISSNRGKKQPVNNTVCAAVFKSTTSLKSFHHHPDELPEHLLHLLHKWDPHCASLPVPSKSKFEETLGPKTAVTVPTKPALIYELLLCLYTKEEDSVINLHPSTGCMAFACLAQKRQYLAFSTHFLDNEKESIIQHLSALTVNLLENHIIQRGLAFQQQFKSSSLPSSSQSSTVKSAISKHAYLVSQQKRKMKKKNKEKSLFPTSIELVSGFSEETWSTFVAVFGDTMSGTLPQTSTTPSSGTLSGSLSGGAIPPASNTPSPTTTTLPTDRLDAIDQALSELHASQADHDKLWVKQASSASSLSDRINHLDQKLETFADVLSNDVKLVRKSNDVALVALNDSISQLQNLLKAQLADKGQKDDSFGSGLGDVQLMQSLLTTETLPTFHGKPNEDPNIFLTSFNRYVTATGWSHQDYILHFEGQLHDNTDVICHFLEQE